MDPNVINRAKRGDKEAFTTLVLTLGDRLYSVAYRMLRDAGRAEDAVQQAFLIAWRELPKLRDESRLEAWLYRLLVNACYAEIRHAGRWQPGLRLVTDLDADPNTDGAQLGVDRRDELERAFRRLSGEQRAVIVMHHYLGLSGAEIAETLGLSPGTVRSRLHYARQRVTIPAPSWYGKSSGRLLIKNDDPYAPGGAGMLVFAGDLLYVYGDPCRWRTTLPDSPATSVDELVAELGNQPTRDASEPVDVTVDGYAGKSITLHVPDDAVFSECDRGEFRTLVEDPLKDGARYHQDPGQIDQLWIVDVNGTLVVIDAAYYGGTPVEHIDELRTIVDSITFGE